MLTGPTALATSVDPVAAAKVAVEFAKTNDRLEIVGGAMGETLLDLNGSRRSPRFRRSISCAHNRGPDPGARDQDRPHRQGAGWPAGARSRRQGRSLSFSFQTTHDIWGEGPSRRLQMADLNKIVDDLSALTVLEAA
jgi:hypothetical protein